MFWAGVDVPWETPDDNASFMDSEAPDAYGANSLKSWVKPRPGGWVKFGQSGGEQFGRYPGVGVKDSGVEFGVLAGEGDSEVFS